jgi:ATP adenylyltransferase
MDRLWTPWRLTYVTEAREPGADCVFCDAIARVPSDALVVFTGRTAFVILNKFPYNSGHLMIVPRRHVGSLVDLARAERDEVMALTAVAERVLGEVYQPHGFNMGLNLGKPAGAGVLGHLHMHVVPRWDGDTNFMSVVGETRVLPEELSQTAARLREKFTGAADTIVS